MKKALNDIETAANIFISVIGSNDKFMQEDEEALPHQIKHLSGNRYFFQNEKIPAGEGETVAVFDYGSRRL